MTKEKCYELVDRYESWLASLGPHKKDRKMVEHLLGMFPTMREFLRDSRTEKFMRWLGFVQGVLWQRRWFTLEELKEHNRL